MKTIQRNTFRCKKLNCFESKQLNLTPCQSKVLSRKVAKYSCNIQNRVKWYDLIQLNLAILFSFVCCSYFFALVILYFRLMKSPITLFRLETNVEFFGGEGTKWCLFVTFSFIFITMP